MDGVRGEESCLSRGATAEFGGVGAGKVVVVSSVVVIVIAVGGSGLDSVLMTRVILPRDEGLNFIFFKDGLWIMIIAESGKLE